MSEKLEFFIGPEWDLVRENTRLRARVRELEDLFQVVKEFCSTRRTTVRVYGLKSANLLKRMEELTEAGGAGE